MTETEKATNVPHLLTTRDVAKQLRAGVRTVERLAADGEIACVRIGRLVRFTPADLAAFIDSRRRPVIA